MYPDRPHSFQDSAWLAELRLRYARLGEATRLAERGHLGPLRVQKSLYPEGPEVCHQIIVHPPAGIAGGDRIQMSLDLGAGSQVLVTTPGAQKWYRSRGPWAYQSASIQVEDSASLEWFPQEAILYNESLGSSSTDVVLMGDAVFMGWDLICLGRVDSGERFLEGSYCPQLKISRDGRLLWFEKGRLHGGSDWFSSPVGLHGVTVTGTFIASSPRLSEAMLRKLQEMFLGSPKMGISMVPGVLVARYLGKDAWEAKRLFSEIWQFLRPALLDRPAVCPRIWAT